MEVQEEEAEAEDEVLKQEFDCIIMGTGMTESVLAAALARAGKKVAHVDDDARPARG